MSSVDWRNSKYYEGKVAWFNGTLYRVTKINNNNYELESGGNFYKQWAHVGNASSMREAEDVCRIHSEGKPGDNVETPKDSTDN